MYEDSTENALYIGGHFSFAGNDTASKIVKWNGSQFSPLGCGLNWDCNPATIQSTGGHVLAITKYNNELYAGGAIVLADGKPVRYIAKWNGVSWDTVGRGLNGVVCMLTIINNELYAGGTFDTAGSVHANSLAKWNGSQWTDVFNFPQINLGHNYVLSIAEYNGELYVGGNFDNDTLSDIIRYNGTAWINVGESLHGGMSSVSKMVAYNNELYVAGTFYHNQGNIGNFIQRWDGTQWKDVGGGTTSDLLNPSANGQIDDMIVHDDKLYIAGVFLYAGGIPTQNVAVWDGNQWCGFGGSFDNISLNVGFCKDTMYLGGGFITIDGDTVNHIAKWTGGNYVDTCGNNSAINENAMESNNVLIYPNPATNEISIKLNKPLENDACISVFNSLGEEVIKLKVQKVESEVKIDVAALPAGMYFVKVNGYSGKFVKH
jgi:hypothetical protein